MCISNPINTVRSLVKGIFDKSMLSVFARHLQHHYATLQNFINPRFMADVREAPMRIGTEDPWALTELAKAGGRGGGGGGVGEYPLSRYFCLSVPWFVTGPLRASCYLRMRDCGSTCHLR